MDPARLSRYSRLAFAWGTVLAVVLLAIGAVVLVTNPGEDYRGSTQYIAQGDEYIAVVEIFGFREPRMVGFWHSGPAEAPDLVRLVDGSDVERILAGQEPQHVHKTFSAWHEGGSTGDMTFVAPDFTCSGETGGCEPGDLPAIVFTRGDAWVGSPASAFVREGEYRVMPSVELRENAAWVMPTVLTLGALATASLVAAIAGGVMWRITARRVPPSPRAAKTNLDGTEIPLQLVHLSRLYLDSIARSLYVAAGVGLLVAAAVQIWGVTYYVDRLFEENLTESGLEVWLWFLHYWIVPIAFVVATVFWVRHLRELQTEKRRWTGVAGRLSSLETQLLG